MDKAPGLILPDGTFKSRDKICAEFATREQSVIHHTPIHQSPDSFDWWHERAMSAQEARQEALGIPEHVEIEIKTQRPVIIGLVGDVHAGGEDVDYELFYKDVQFLKQHPLSYVMLLGDLTDSFFFVPAVHKALLNLEEQYGYMKSAVRELKGKILVSWAGNHDMWASRMGPTLYEEWTKENGHYLEGLSFVSLKVGDQEYKISGSHKHNGFSIYNHAHPSLRMKRDGSEGGDIYITAHKHKKAYVTQYQNMYGGKALQQHFLSLGTYKSTDDYSRGSGFVRQKRNQMGATFVVLHPDRKQVEVLHTREEAGERVASYFG